MEKIPTGFMGYKKEVVNNIIEKQNNLLKTQQKDIDKSWHAFKTPLLAPQRSRVLLFYAAHISAAVHLQYFPRLFVFNLV